MIIKANHLVSDNILGKYTILCYRTVVLLNLLICKDIWKTILTIEL